MGRYIGPKSKIARKFGEAIFGADRVLEKRNFPPGQHGLARKRKKVSEYGQQLSEKQKAKATYGLLEKQFSRTYEQAARMGGITGENLLKLLECRLDNVVYRLGIAPTRAAARQLVSHCHICVNGNVVNIPSYSLKVGDIVSVREKVEKFGSHCRISGRRFEEPLRLARVGRCGYGRQVPAASRARGDSRKHQGAAYRRVVFQVVIKQPIQYYGNISISET